jgi:hypothetical protein
MMRFSSALMILGIAQLFVLNQSLAEPFNVTLNSEQWDMPRHGETLIKQPELGKLVRLWSAQPDGLIDIRYPGGEEGELWVQELMDWLVALGVPSKAMRHSPGSGGEDIIKLELNSKQVKGNKVDE